MTIRACLFDAYGTLFDLHSAIGRYRNELGSDAQAISALWRTKQLEYTWLRSLMGQYADFRQVTEEALRYTFATYGITNQELFERLLQAYLTLDVYSDVAETLRIVKERGVGRFILSNGSPAMLEAGIHHAGLGSLLDATISVESLRIYKPAPRIYQLGMERAGITNPSEILFVSANGWDIAGAGAFGFQTAWINRAASPIEELPARPTYIIAKVSDILGLFGKQ